MVAIILLDCLAIALTFLWLSELRWRRRCGNLPPGPTRYPIIGSALHMPRANASQGFSKLAETYGDVVYLQVFNQGLLILNSREAAAKALNLQGEASAGRPILVMAGELSGFDRFLGLMQNGKRLQQGRTYLNNVIAPSPAQKYADAQQSAVLRLLRKLAIDPDNFAKHSRWIVASCILLISHGYSTEDNDDPFIAASSAVMRNFGNAAKPGKWLVDIFPFVKHLPDWFPGAGFKQLAITYRAIAGAAFREPFLMVKERLRAGTAKPSLVASFLDELAHSEGVSGAQEDFIMFTMGDLFGAGIETMTSAVTSFFLAMAKNQAIQQKAQAEIDALCKGERRLPTFKDKAELPYVEALVWEVLRWGAITPLGLPHRYTTRDTLAGYDIPENTIAFANITAISYDSRTYPDPEAFSPERFLGPKPQSDPRKVVFGYGRRVCPGAGLAEQIIFIIASSTLATFNILPRKGQSYIVDRSDAVISLNKPFLCDIEFRSEGSRELIAER